MTHMERDIDTNSRVKRMRAATHAAHAALDGFIMQAKPFEGRENFARFVQTQYLFHRDLSALFSDPRLDALLPDLAGRNRLAMVEQDLADLGVERPEADEPVFASGAEPDLAEALGWLYVVEGSNLGAAFLLKYAANLGLDENFGARHLAGAPEGRGLHWRTFIAALDEIELDEAAEARAVAGAEAAFRRVHAYAERMMAA